MANLEVTKQSRERALYEAAIKVIEAWNNVEEPIMVSPTVQVLVTNLEEMEKATSIFYTSCLNLDSIAWNDIKIAATQSKWLLKDTPFNEWVQHVLEFLRNGRSIR